MLKISTQPCFLDKNKDKYITRSRLCAGDHITTVYQLVQWMRSWMTNLLFSTCIQKIQDLANNGREAVSGFAFSVKKGGKHEKLITEFVRPSLKWRVEHLTDGARKTDKTRCA